MKILALIPLLLAATVSHAEVLRTSCRKTVVSPDGEAQYSIRVDPTRRIMVIEIDDHLVLDEVVNIETTRTSVFIHALTKDGSKLTVKFVKPGMDDTQDSNERMGRRDEFIKSINVQTGIEHTNDCGLPDD